MTETVQAEGWSPAIPAQAIAQVIQKLADGTYPTEPVRCFCGADFNDTVVAVWDRYFIPHRNVLCNECGLIRATPRMTEAAYREFYNTEYRPIYDGWQFQKDATNDSLRFMVQGERGCDFKQFLEYFDLKPKTIVDVGANLGGMLLPFQEEGAKVVGVECYEHGFAYGNEHGIPMYRSVQQALDLGIKADLVIMQDVVEHLTDLRYLLTVKDLLAKDGVLYIGTPGVFMAKLPLLFQNAHTYTFIAETLRYVMSQLGFEEIYLDENIDSLWVYHGEPGGVSKPANWCRYIVEHLQQKEMRSCPPIRGVNKFPVTERWKNMDANLGRHLPDIKTICGQYAGACVIVAGGPSANAELPTIRRLVSEGAKLMVIERMYPWCAANNLHPDFVVALDASGDVVEGFTQIQPETIHLVGCTVHPDAVALLEGHPAYIFNGISPHMKVQNLWHKHGYTDVRIINTGGSVSLCAFALAATLGFRNLHLVGFDLKIVNGSDYAAGIAGHGVTRKYFEAEVEGKTVTTCIAFLSFAQQFFKMAEDARKAGMLDSIDVHGDSLINDMWKRPDSPCSWMKECGHGE